MTTDKKSLECKAKGFKHIKAQLCTFSEATGRKREKKKKVKMFFNSMDCGI